MTRPITIPRDRLALALERVVPAASVGSPMPILTTIKIVAGGGGIALSATDTEVLIEEHIAEPTPEPWAGCADASRLAGYVASLPKGGDVLLIGGEDRLEVRQGRSAARLLVLPADDFPVWREAPKAEEFTIGSNQLAAALRAVNHAIASDDARRYLGGVCLHTAPGGCVAVATDGHTLALHHLPAWPEGRSIIVPRATCDRLLRLLRGFSSDLSIRLSASTLAVSAGAWSLRSKLIDGEFPNYGGALPPRSPNPARVDRAALLAAVTRIAQIARDGESRGMTLEVAAGELCLSGGASGQLGGAEDVLAITGGASPARVHLNTKYLTDALRSIEAATVELHIGLPMQAVWLCAADEARDGALVLPMRG